MDPSQGQEHAMSVFGHLTRCITFDRDRFGKDVDIFERALEYTKTLGSEKVSLHAMNQPSNRSKTIDETQQSALKSTGDPFERANVIRKRNKIKVSGTAPPVPITQFDDMEALAGTTDNSDSSNGSESKMFKRLLHNIKVVGKFEEPTAVQKQSIPALYQGRELMVVAPTGSGKTLAFLIPLIMRVKQQKQQKQPVTATSSIKAVVISPTKELSMQTGRVLMPLLPGLKLRCSILSKATAAGSDFNSKVDILLANPLRLESLTKNGTIDLSQVETLVLDEADKLFEMGFSEQIDACLSACTNQHIVKSLFSATLPETVEHTARSVLRDPLRITVGERNVSATSVDQKLMFVGRENGKILAIRQLISDGLRPPVLVFVNTKERAKEVHKELMFEGVHVDSLHASQSHAAREKAVEKFRQGKTWVLIATDLVARGLDFAGVETVINFDFPRSTIDYVHRVGRTGRAGRSGKAITFFTEEDVGGVRAVANIIKAAGGDVDPWMLKLKKVRPERKRKKIGDVVDDNVDGTDGIILPEKKTKTKQKNQEKRKTKNSTGKA